MEHSRGYWHGLGSARHGGRRGRRSRRRRRAYCPALCALELPHQVAPGVEVVRVSQPRGRVRRLKLSRQLHLIPSQQLTAQRARPAKSKSAQRAVRSSRWQLRSADRFSRLLPEERLVGHDASYVAGPRFAPRLAPYAMRPGEPDGRRPKPTRSGAAAPRHVTGGDRDLKSTASRARGADPGLPQLVHHRNGRPPTSACSTVTEPVLEVVESSGTSRRVFE
jgi:hypothetical protein